MTTAPPTRSRNPLQWFAQGGWYFFVVVLTFGVLACIPFAHAASRLRNPLHWIAPVAYIAAIVTAFATTRQNDPSSPGAWIALSTVLVALVHLTWLRRQVWPAGGAAPAKAAPAAPAADPSADPAVVAALAARKRRADARRIVADDPLLARELRIGRPDLRRDYDDGGLVDLNAAPAPAIAATCGIDAGLAQRIVDARAAAGTPFGQVDDVFAWTDIPVALWDRIRDRAVAL